MSSDIQFGPPPNIGGLGLPASPPASARTGVGPTQQKSDWFSPGTTTSGRTLSARADPANSQNFEGFAGKFSSRLTEDIA